MSDNDILLTDSIRKQKPPSKIDIYVKADNVMHSLRKYAVDIHNIFHSFATEYPGDSSKNKL